LKMVAFIEKLKRNCPRFFFCSDSPAFDVRLLDAILAKHHHAPISHRNDSVYHQSLCTWSYRLALSTVLGVRTNSIEMAASHIPKAKREVSDRVTKKQHPKHTALFDCYCIADRHFRMMDVASDLHCH
jgi:hypothetical protein